jgi:hypothetical protein
MMRGPPYNTVRPGRRHANIKKYTRNVFKNKFILKKRALWSGVVSLHKFFLLDKIKVRAPKSSQIFWPMLPKNSGRYG